MIKEIKSSSGHTYKIDTEKVTCTCPNWMYRCRHAIKGSPESLCKHLKQELEENPKAFPKEYSGAATTFDEVKVVMDDKVRYPRMIFDKYVRNLKLLVNTAKSIKQSEVCGSYRRMAQLVSDLDLLVVLSDPSNPDSINELYNKIKLAYPNHEVLAQGNLKMMIMLDGIVHLDVKVVPEDAWGCALMHFTGSKQENVRLRRKASSMGLKLNEYGLWTEDGANVNLAAGKSEQEIYELLKEQYKAPWER